MEHQTGLDGPDGPEQVEHAEQAEQAEHVEQAEPELEGAAVPERAPEPGPATGEPRVDAALRLLDRLPGLPVSEHAELYERVRGQLSDVLGELDSGPAGPAGD